MISVTVKDKNDNKENVTEGSIALTVVLDKVGEATACNIGLMGSASAIDLMVLKSALCSYIDKLDDEIRKSIIDYSREESEFKKALESLDEDLKNVILDYVKRKGGQA